MVALLAILLCALPPHHSDTSADAAAPTTESCSGIHGEPNTATAPEDDGESSPENVLVCHNTNAAAHEQAPSPVHTPGANMLFVAALMVLPRLSCAPAGSAAERLSRRRRYRFSGYFLLLSIGVSRT